MPPFAFLHSEYDIYGFRTVPEDDEEEKLVAKVRALDLKSLHLTDSQEVSTGVKWENYFASTVNREMACSPELKNLIRAGIPHEHRSKVWKWCVDRHARKFRDAAEPGHFQALLQRALEKQNPASKQIELDLLRTLPNNKHYSCPTSEGIQKLRNVLLAFSWRNPDIGYCQGLNRCVLARGSRHLQAEPRGSELGSGPRVPGAVSVPFLPTAVTAVHAPVPVCRGSGNGVRGTRQLCVCSGTPRASADARPGCRGLRVLALPTSGCLCARDEPVAGRRVSTGTPLAET